MSIIGEFAIKLDEDKRIKVWVDDFTRPDDSSVYKFWLKPTTKVLLVYNDQTDNYTQVTATEPIVISPVKPSLEEGQLWLDTSVVPARFRRQTSNGLMDIVMGDIILGTGGNATLQARSSDQTINSPVDIVTVLDIPNLLLNYKLQSGRIRVNNTSPTNEVTLYYYNKVNNELLDQVFVPPGRYVAFEYIDVFPVIIKGTGNFRFQFDGYVLI